MNHFGSTARTAMNPSQDRGSVALFAGILVAGVSISARYTGFGRRLYPDGRGLDEGRAKPGRGHQFRTIHSYA